MTIQTQQRATVLTAPYDTLIKPYGRALVELAREREDVVCFTGDLTRQCEIDLFQDEIPERFIHAGMAEANMMGVAAAMARTGYKPFVHTFGVFATRRPFDQIVNAIAYPNLPVRIIGFMPGLSTPGGPSHQAIDDVAIMRAVPNMTVIDVADATEVSQVARAIVDIDGPVYVRLKRGEIPVLFPKEHRLSLDAVQPLTDGGDVTLFASGMMVATALSAREALAEVGVSIKVVNVPSVKPLDAAGIVAESRGSRAVMSLENHSIIGGLGSAVAEALSEAGLGVPMRRLGVQDLFAEGSKTGPYLFEKYGLSAKATVNAVWQLLERSCSAPEVAGNDTAPGEYAPV